MGNVASIQDETVRQCYSNPSSKNIAEPVYTLRDGTVVEVVAVNQIVGRVDDLTTVQDPVVRRAIGI